MTDLIQRIETAPEPSVELFCEAFGLLRGIWPGHIDIPHPNYEQSRRFKAMLDAQAWTSAAEMLVPDRWGGSIHFSECRRHNTVKLGRSYPTNATVYAEHTHPSLALLASILKANGEA